MIKDNQQHFNRLHVIIDAFVIVVSYILAWWLKFSSGILDSPGGTVIWILHEGTGRDCSVVSDFVLCV